MAAGKDEPSAQPPGTDLLDPVAVDDQHRYFAALRERDPVIWSPEQQGWVLTRYADVAAALGDPRLSSDRARPLLDVLHGERLVRTARVLDVMQHWMVVNDPPMHTRLRRLAARALRPQRVQAMRARVARLVDELLDEFVAGGHRDLIEHFAFPLPATVIAELIGAPPEDRARFRHWSHELALVAFGAGGDARDARHDRASHGLEEMLAYFDELIERARGTHGEHMIADLLAGDGSEDRLSDEELRAMCALMLFAGHETTTSLIAAAVMLLLRNPDQLASLRGDPELIGGAVEEALRCEGPARALVRWVTEDLEIGGKRIAAGERVFAVLPAANRDPERFPDADRFDIRRHPNVHLAFGKGIHACIGALLARIEARIAVAAIVERLPGLALADQQLQWAASIGSHGLERLEVEHRAARAGPRREAPVPRPTTNRLF
ncbi:MAG TPA: cytochrome P450 [Solirubrobacteraceae bacterium]|nr:cytochrome P450 [Solirubrobacteraceae bacterium]